MKEQELREKLYQRLEQEFNDYKDYLKTLPPDKILENAYQYIMKEETYGMFYPKYEKFDMEQIRALNKTEAPLDELYQGWMNSDVNLNELYEDNVYDTLDTLVDEQKEKSKKNKAMER